MNEATCIRCGRQITYVKNRETHELFALEKVRAFQIDISAIGSIGIPVEPANDDALYIAHISVCPKKDKQ